jgi:Sel1 repeat
MALDKQGARLRRGVMGSHHPRTGSPCWAASTSCRTRRGEAALPPPQAAVHHAIRWPLATWGHARMRFAFLHTARRFAVQVTTLRWGMLLVALWVGGLAGCTSAGHRRAMPPLPHSSAAPQPGPTQEEPGEVDALRQQAVQGNVEAQYRLGMMVHTGEGVPQNEAEAVQWLQRAAMQGHPEAQRLLGRFYLAGQGVPRNEAEAVYWYRRAADQGDPERQWQLGLKYLHGLGVPQDVVQAYLWLSLAATHLPSGPLRDNAARACTRAAQKMTPAQWAQAQALVSQWQPRTAP